MRYEHIRKAALDLKLILTTGAPTKKPDKTHFQEGIWEIFALLENEWAYNLDREEDLAALAHNEDIMQAQIDLLALYLELKKLDAQLEAEK